MRNIFILIGVLCLTSAFIMDVASNGAPASATGAPSEESCGMATCHDDGTANSGPGEQHLTTLTGSTYVPGENHSFSVTIEESDVVRFGFQVLALDQNNNNVGEFVVTDADRTQVISNYTNLTDRKYITYKFAGTSAVTTGTGMWTFDWIAPSEDVGPVTFYYATVAANDDYTDDGDNVYFGSLSMNSAPVGINSIDEVPAIKLTSNGLLFTNAQNETYSIHDLAGKQVMEGNINSNQETLNHELTTGAYIVRLSNGTSIKFVAP